MKGYCKFRPYRFGVMQDEEKKSMNYMVLALQIFGVANCLARNPKYLCLQN